MPTEQELRDWENADDPRVLALVGEVRRLRASLTEVLADVERLVGWFAKLAKASGEQGLENARLRHAKLSPGRN